MRWPWGQKKPGAAYEPPAGLVKLDAEHLDVIEKQLERQEAAMTSRLSNTSTRAAVLIGVSGALGGTELVTASGNAWISGISLALYLGAAVCGLFAMRSRLTEQPALDGTITEYAAKASEWMRRSLVGSRLASQKRSRTQLRHRHNWLIGGFIVLMAAWVASGAGTIYGIVNPQPAPPTIIQIEGDIP
ncbi:hypothetical protein AB2L57_01735 [Microbacterium sp. HA-8]|uniref:hypothetical protein n=1 Tax=unclassified Microbacterium TaxID=2609290 RepID=UPI0012FE6423|nr:hypothetical protein [Microbacterium sp. BR1]